jgi:large subunit ribosomal protein L21
VYAIIETGGKQYRVSPGDVVRVEHLAGEAGDTVTLGEVLLVGGEEGTRIGAPHIPDASVRGTLVEQGRDRKVRVFKFKRRKHYRRTRGHRQAYTAVRIDAIEA